MALVSSVPRACRAAVPSARTARPLVPALRTLARPAARPTVASASAGTATSVLQLHSGETTISVPWTADHAGKLDAAINELLATFAAKAKAERPQRWNAMDIRLTGIEGLKYAEFFSNPNAATTAFDAKVLVTIVSSGGLSVTTEARLSAVKADIDAFLASAK